MKTKQELNQLLKAYVEDVLREKYEYFQCEFEDGQLTKGQVEYLLAIKVQNILPEEEFKVGDKLIALKDCLMEDDGRKAITEGKEYVVVSLDGCFAVMDDEGDRHWFDVEDGYFSGVVE